jgi:hypothetical protein
MNRLSVWISSIAPSVLQPSLAGRARPAGSVWRVGAAQPAGAVLFVGTALLAGMAPQSAGAQPGTPAPLVQAAPPAAAAPVVPPSPIAQKVEAAVLPSPPAEEIEADSELPALRPLDRLVARLDPNHVDGVGLAYIAGQAAALFKVLAAQAEQDAASWQGEGAGHGVADSDETAHARETHPASPVSRASPTSPASPASPASGAPQSSGAPRSGADVQSSTTLQSRDTIHASAAVQASESEERGKDSPAAKAQMLAVRFSGCAADFELVARWLTLSHDTQDLKQRDAQQAELESLYWREVEKHRAAGLGRFPPSMRRDYDAAMEIHPAVKTLADHWRRELIERASGKSSGKDNQDPGPTPVTAP